MADDGAPGARTPGRRAERSPTGPQSHGPVERRLDGLPSGAWMSRRARSPSQDDAERPDADRGTVVSLRQLPGQSSRARHNLPAALTSFVGREREIEEIKRLLRSTRLLTLYGTGGIGKTRLALQVAAELMREHPDGVRLVELEELADAALIPQAIASVLGVREQPGRPLLETL